MPTNERNDSTPKFFISALAERQASPALCAAVAIPAYQDYVAKSKFAAALGEVSAGKTGFEVQLNDGASFTTPDAVGLATTATANCKFKADSAAGTLTCNIQGGPSTVQGQDIILTRDTNGNWTCAASTVKQKLIGTAGVCLGST